MSLNQNKEALFGKSSNKSSSSSSTATARPPAPATSSASQPVSKTAGMSFGSSLPKSGSGKGKIELSPEAKRKKLEEARELQARGMKNLQTSMFQWSPDHLTAAPYFEQSSDAYKQAGDYEHAITMALKAAESYEACNTLASAALAKNKASQCAKELNDSKRAAKYLEDCAETWAINGDLQKYGEVLAKVAKELEDVDNKKAEEMYFKSIGIICPDDTPKDAIKKCLPSIIEILRGAFTFLLRIKAYKSAIKLSNKMISVFQGFEIEASLCKAFAGVTILQLTMGDVVQAQQTYLQEHLNNAIYLRSKECEMMDNLLMACNNMDADLLDKVQRDPQMHYLDMELQKLIKKISLFEMNGEEADDNVVQTTSKASAADEKSSLFAAKKPLSRQVPPPPPPMPQESGTKPPAPASTSDLLAKHLDDLDIKEDSNAPVVSNAELDDIMAGLEDFDGERDEEDHEVVPPTKPTVQPVEDEPTVNEEDDEDDESRYL